MNHYFLIIGLISGILFFSYSPPCVFAKEKNSYPINISTGAGVGKNIFYTPTNTEESGFVFVELAYNDSFGFFKTDWNFTFDGIYSGKYFFAKPEANDLFASGFMELSDSSGKLEFGVSNDPQYTRFVTSDTVGGLLSIGKQRILSDKVRLFGIYGLTNFQKIESGIGFKTKDYLDSDSDYSEWSLDALYNVRLSAITQFTIGTDYENRNFHDRLSSTSSGLENPSQTLAIVRFRPYVKFGFIPTVDQEYSIKYKYLHSKDTSADWFTYTENSIIGFSKYNFTGNMSLSGNVRLDFRDYEKKTGDDGSKLKETIIALSSKMTFPGELILKNSFLFISFDYSKSDSKINSTDYENMSILLGGTVSL